MGPSAFANESNDKEKTQDLTTGKPRNRTWAEIQQRNQCDRRHILKDIDF